MEKNCIAYFSHTKMLKCNAWETVKQRRKYVTFKLLNGPNKY